MKHSNLSILLISFLITIINNTEALEGKNYTARYLEGARLKCKTNLHREILLQAFHDIINHSADTLRTLKYENDKANGKKLSLLDVFNRYIKPNRPDKKIGPGFYDELKTDEVKYKIKDILYALNNQKSENRKSISSKSRTKEEWILRIKSLFDIIIPQNAENFACLEETLFTRSIFARFTLSSNNEIKLFLAENAKLLGIPAVYSNPLKDMAVDVRIKNKWHPELLLQFSGGTHALWKRSEKRTYYYVFGKQNKEEFETVYLVCVAE